MSTAFYLLLLWWCGIATQAKYWIVKTPRGTREKNIGRVEKYLGNGKWIVYSKENPKVNNSIEFNSTMMNTPSLPYNNHTRLVYTNKGCFVPGAVKVTSRLYQLEKGQELPEGCVAFDEYNKTDDSEFKYWGGDVEINTVRSFMNTSISISTDYIDTSGENGLVVDSGLDTEHCFFTPEETQDYYNYYDTQISIASSPNKVIAYIKHTLSDFFDATSGHGTHVAGIHGGLPCGSRRGVSLGRFVFLDIGASNGGLYLPSNLIGVFQSVYSSLGIVYMKGSWGAYVRGYDSLSAQIDHYVYDTNPEFLPILASGNNCPVNYITSPGGTCKSAVSVGSCNLLGTPEAYTCKISDKMVPLVYIPGSEIVSAYAETTPGPHYLFTKKSGTSMSTPALPIDAIQARLRQLSLSKPTNALKRCVLMANSDGINRVLRFKNQFFTNDAKWDFFDYATVPLQKNYKKCYIVNNTAEFTATLAWVDPPGPELVNDLDLMILWSGTNWAWGNYGKTSDIKNTNEIITILPGTIQTQSSIVTVVVSDTTSSSQQFALVVTSSYPLVETTCNTTCSFYDPPIECDYDNQGSLGYNICNTNGEIDMRTCKFHSCAAGKALNQVGECNEDVSGQVTIYAGNSIRSASGKRVACRERCFYDIGEADCKCPYNGGYSQNTPPSSGLGRRSSATNGRINNILLWWLIGFFIFAII